MALVYNAKVSMEICGSRVCGCRIMSDLQEFSTLTKHRFGKLIALLVLLLWILAGCSSERSPESTLAAPSSLSEERSAAQTQTPKPDVIWILLDAARARNFSSYGYERPTTPNMDNLASQGVLFELNFSQSVHTKGSVPSYMTGRYFATPVHKPMPKKGKAIVYRDPPPGEKLLPEIMAENGYETVFITTHTWFPKGSRLYRAFQERILIPLNEREDEYKWIPAGFDKINEEVFKILDQPAEKPRFLYIHALDTHFPHILEAPYDKWLIPGYDSEQMKKVRQNVKEGLRFTDSDMEQMRGLYDGGLRYADEQVGLLIKRLEEKGLGDNTVVIISSDHGELLGENGKTWAHPFSAHEYLIHVPLVMAGPLIPKGKRIDHITENVDIVPTLVDLLALETEAQLDGKSLVPLMQADNHPPLREYAFVKWGEYSNPDGNASCLILRGKEFKYEFYPQTNRERLVSVQEYEIEEPNVKEKHSEIAKSMRDYMRKEIFPLAEVFKSIPTSVIEVIIKRNMEELSTSPEAYIVEKESMNRESRSDNKWSYSLASHWVWAAWEEDAPPLTFRVKVPPGRYVAQLGIYFHPNFWKEKPASAILVKAETDQEFKRVAPDSSPAQKRGVKYVDIGVYEIEDGYFDIVVDDADRDHWSILKGFRFIPLAAEGEESPEEAERLEQLRALGYL